MKDATNEAEYIEKLNAAHEFPKMFTFKLIGKNAPAFEAGARDAVRAMYPDLDPTISRRESAQGRHVSLTVEMLVPNAEAVVALYRRFNALPGLHMLM